VATVALNGAKNAGILAAQIIASSNLGLLEQIKAFKEDLKNKVMDTMEHDGTIIL
jgi:5-(carboxyamino)imidazole ribonucleotide mutase